MLSVLVELILHAMAKGKPLSCESQGVLRLAACEPSFMAVLRAPSVSACGRCWMLMDGVWWWCSTLCCLIFLLNGVWQGERKSAAKDALLSLGLLWLTLACFKVGLFLWWLCMLSFLSFFIWERTGELKREGGEGAEKDSMHTSRHRKNATEDDSNLPHTPAS